MKTYFKTVARMFKKHLTRFISIIFIVVVAVGVISGIGSSTEKIKYSMTDYYVSQNVSDLILKYAPEDENYSLDGFLKSGFDEEQITKVKEIFGEENVNSGMSLDAEIEIGGEKLLTRLYFLDEFEKPTVNVFETLAGTDAAVEEGETAVYAEVADNKIKGVALGEKITLDFKDILKQLLKQANMPEEDYNQALSFLGLLDTLNIETKKDIKVTKTVKSPLTFANDGEPSYLNGELEKVPTTIGGLEGLIQLQNIIFLPSSVIPDAFGVKLLFTGDLYVACEDRSYFNAFDKGYKDYIETQKANLLEKSGIAAEEVQFVSLYKNYSFVSLNGYADKVMQIGLILMVAFVFVTSLVAQSTMTRLMEEERTQIACLRTLGYSSFKIIFKYLLFAVVAAVIGGTVSYFVGLGLAHLLYVVFEYSFMMPPITSTVALPFYFIVLSVIVVITLLSTLIVGLKLTHETPANLLRPKPPKAGKKVFLEKIPFIWKHLSFKYKSTVRNVLRYFGRFIMTVVSVAVSNALVLVGLALLDVCLFGGLNSRPVMGVAVVIIVFAGLLIGSVIYTLTNINVSERNRELATLKVLGYHDKEVKWYIYREVYIDTAVGIIFGYPLAVFLMDIVFKVIEMGAIGGVSWFWWLVAPAIVFIFAFLVTLMLSGKIVKIDMNESLKAVE